MMAFILVIACGFAALRNPSLLMASTVYTTTWAILLVAILCAIYHDGPKRYFWMGFAIFGWGHFLLSFPSAIAQGSVPFLLPALVFALSRSFLEPNPPALMRLFVDATTTSSNDERFFTMG